LRLTARQKYFLVLFNRKLKVKPKNQNTRFVTFVHLFRDFRSGAKSNIDFYWGLPAK